METITDDRELAEAGFYWRERDGVRALVCRPLEQDGFVNGFSTRQGGVSPMPQDSLSLAGFHDDAAENILENRRRFLKLFPGQWSLAGCWQVHGADVRVVNSVAEAKPAEDQLGETIYCDVIVSNAEHVLAGVKTADCVPILIGDPWTRSFAAVHAGWRGTLATAVIEGVKRLSDEYGARAEDLRAAIGASAGPCCYEVGSDVIDAFTSRFPDGAKLFAPTRPGHALVDLITANRDQLESTGVLPKRIHVLPLCTMCRTDLFFSYRNEKKLHGKVGRLMAVIGKQ
ncbi:MAG TPA: peptidoglycan editing factor PgeF [Pyrinomonadaceae bacterium]|jgi:YfiH family protein|nr:peptidoglycan editing factor PgeF [Pyrinomonadaceae bacterium]